MEMLLGQIPEAIYFSLFVIFCKGTKEKRTIFILLSIFQYLILANLFPFNSWFQFIYVWMMWLNCKFLFKDKSDIRDLMFIILSTITLGIISLPCYFIFNKNMILVSTFRNILLLLLLIMSKNKLKNLNNIYLKYWNRNDKIKKKITSVSFRIVNIILINVTFTIINLVMIFGLYVLNR